MRDVYSKPVSLELNSEPIQHYRIESVKQDEFDSNTFIAKYEVLDDEKKTFYPFEVRVPKVAVPEGPYWKPIFESVGVLYSRKEDRLTYGYKIIQLIIDDIYKQTKVAPPKKSPAQVKSEDELDSKALSKNNSADVHRESPISEAATE